MTEMYSDLLLDVVRHPLNKQTLAHFDAQFGENNPSCGDTVAIALQIKNNTIAAIGWQGDGCAVMQASASLLTEHCKGKKISALKKFNQQTVTKLLGLQTVSPARLRCALLPLEALRQCLSK